MIDYLCIIITIISFIIIIIAIIIIQRYIHPNFFIVYLCLIYSFVMHR